MNKPSYEELERQLAAQKTTIERLKKGEHLRCKHFDSVPKNSKIIELIREGNEDAVDYYYRDANPNFLKLVGMTRPQLIGKRFKELFEPIDKFWLELYNEVAKTGNSISYKNTSSNNGKYYEVFVWEIEKNLIAVTFADITERKKQELKIIADKERAEENDQIKENFISNLSHEIRTPMNGILGFTKFLDDPNISDIKRKHYVTIIQNSGNQLMRTMDDLLEFSKLGTKQVTLNEKERCLNNLTLELFTIFDVKAKENKIPLYLRKGLSDIDSTVLIDDTKLNNVLGNLLENALKFTSKGFIEFGYNKVGSNLEFYVKDTGDGIKYSRQKSVFERFSKEEKDSSKNVGGLGLGLWIARENTELLGGKITLESKKDVGTTFFVTIPYAPTLRKLEKNSAADSLNKQVTKKENEHKFTILIAEDEEINFLFLEILLNNQIDLECTIIHAKNGAEAVSICEENAQIDFVLMDLKMPVMDGFEAIKMIREIRPDLPIVAQTAFSSNNDKERVIAAGFNDFLSKPINKEALEEIINKQKRIKESLNFKN